MNAPATRTPIENPVGTDGFEFVEYTALRSGAAAHAVRAARLPGHGAASQQERHAAPAGRHQLHHQCGAGQLRPALRARARPVGVRDGVPRQGCRCAPTSAASSSAPKPVETRVGPMELHIPAIEGIGGSLIYLVDRYGERTIYDVDFVPVQRRARRARRRPDVHRSSDAQRRARQHEQVGRLLREAVQLPRDPLLRHRRQEDRPVQPRDDQPVRQDPHPDQRVAGRQVADRGVPAASIGGEGIQHIALGTAGHRRHGRRAARAGRAVPGHARHIL